MLAMDMQSGLIGRIDDVSSESRPPSLEEVLPSGDALEATVKELIRTARRVLANVRKGSKVSPRVQAQARAVVDELGAALRIDGQHAFTDHEHPWNCQHRASQPLLRSQPDPRLAFRRRRG